MENNGLVHLHLCCFLFAFRFVFFCFCFAFILFFLFFAWKEKAKIKIKSKSKKQKKTTKMQMDKSMCFPFFPPFWRSFFPCFPFILLLCVLDFADLLFVFFLFLLVSLFIQVLRKVRISYGLADITLDKNTVTQKAALKHCHRFFLSWPPAFVGQDIAPNPGSGDVLGALKMRSNVAMLKCQVVVNLEITLKTVYLCVYNVCMCIYIYNTSMSLYVRVYIYIYMYVNSVKWSPKTVGSNSKSG